MNLNNQIAPTLREGFRGRGRGRGQKREMRDSHLLLNRVDSEPKQIEIGTGIAHQPLAVT